MARYPDRFLILIRHGESEANVSPEPDNFTIEGGGTIPGSRLTEKGKSQAETTGKALFKIKTDIDFIYTSPTLRTLETSQIIAGSNKNQPIVAVKSELKEFHFGKAEKMPIKEIARNFPKEFALWQNCPKDRFRFPGSPLNFGKYKKNINDFIIKKIKKWPEEKDSESENITIVAHAIAIRALLSEFLKIPLESTWKMRFPNCGTTIMRYSADTNGTYCLKWVEYLNHTFYKRTLS